MKCLQTGGLRVEVGRHLYRTGFLRANGLQFCKGILHEDEEFTPRVLLQAQRVVLTGQEIYYYDNCRAGSITHAEGLSTRRVQDRLRIYDSLAEIYRTVTPRALRRRLQDDLPNDEVLYDLAELFRVFGDSTRIKILYALFESELCVNDIAQVVGISQSAVSHQLRVLKTSKLVKFRREGKAMYYSLDDDHVRSMIALGMEHTEE